jgi:uncharacterized membrane protein YphA (DoxX/SURF4 family)
MRKLDRLLSAWQRWVRARPLLYRLTLGTRLLLAVGFVPTGMVKLLGRRFTLMSPESDIGGFFETLYRSGLYWHFLGLTQVVAGLLVLSNATATAGALIFFGIMLNVFVITLSYDFHFTPVVTGLMLLATLYLLLWDYDRLRGVFGLATEAVEAHAPMPGHRLSGALERGAYVAGLVFGLGFFFVTRGLLVPRRWGFRLMLGCLASFVLALICGLAARSRQAPRD